MCRGGQPRRAAQSWPDVRERLPDQGATLPCARSTSREMGGSARVTFLVTASRSSPPWPFPAAAHSRWTGPLSSGSEVGDGAVALGCRRGICAFEIAVHEPGDVGAAAEARLLRRPVQLAKTLHIEGHEDLWHSREDRGRVPSARDQSLDARWYREAGGRTAGLLVSRRIAGSGTSGNGHRTPCRRDDRVCVRDAELLTRLSLSFVDERL